MKEQLYPIPVNDIFDKDCECPVCAIKKSLDVWKDRSAPDLPGHLYNMLNPPPYKGLPARFHKDRRLEFPPHILPTDLSFQ